MSKKAFTLVELAVVLVVIGILAGLLLRNLGSFTSTARDTRRIGDLRNVSVYLYQYYLKVGNYPTTTTWDALAIELVNKGILFSTSTLPRDPGRRSYSYYYCNPTSTPQNFILTAQLDVDRTQAPDLYKESASPTGWSCAPSVPKCDAPTTYCLAQ